MIDKGWISLHRQIQDHWIYKSRREFSQFEAWIDILLSVNHEKANVIIKFEVFECQRGQSLYSLETWAKRWKWDKNRVRRFLSLLEKEHMIETQNERKTTRLTVCKYDSYQVNKNAKETQNERKTTLKRTVANPNNNDNKDNTKVLSERTINFKKSLYPFVGQYPKEMVEAFFNYWSEPNKTNTKMKFELQVTFEVSRRLATWSSNNFKSKQQSNNYISGLTGN